MYSVIYFRVVVWLGNCSSAVMVRKYIIIFDFYYGGQFDCFFQCCFLFCDLRVSGWFGCGWVVMQFVVLNQWWCFDLWYLDYYYTWSGSGFVTNAFDSGVMEGIITLCCLRIFLGAKCYFMVGGVSGVIVAFRFCVV